nr:immunoglobulin heavy chain junction region [Macaca mulatta]MOX38144.1 immunoglobulin heavy chain junction region [Macaca mulatta]MOX38582.1 immunoglobulin heavy chain junction region [Macaca mulatta]MOX38740.1 immunoglobulin heavy chain junction region [Macaca mulatta]MOX39803.1 immunoglobulin heavy chain junction region [Macaca mulatta]
CARVKYYEEYNGYYYTVGLDSW